MTRLILTFTDSGAGALKAAGLADCVIPFGLRFVCGQLQSPSEFDMLLSPPSAIREASAPHWLDNLADECLDEARSHGLGLVEFCERFMRSSYGSIRMRTRNCRWSGCWTICDRMPMSPPD